MAFDKNTREIKGTKSYSKMHGKLNSTKMHIWFNISSQLSEIIALLGLAKVKLQTPLIFVRLLHTKSKCSSITGQYDVLECTQLYNQSKTCHK